MRRKQNDVFVLGDESLIAEPISPREPAPAAITDAREGGGSLPPRSSPRPAGLPAGSALGARKLAVLGLGAAAAATLGVLELSGSGAANPQDDQASSRSALVGKPAPSAAAPATHPVLASPVDSKPRPRRPHVTVQRRAHEAHPSKPEREPTSQEAPVSLPVQASVPPPAPVASPAPAPVPPPTVPSPPPPSGGGGSGSVESFGFEH